MRGAKLSAVKTDMAGDENRDCGREEGIAGAADNKKLKKKENAKEVYSTSMKV